ncbi:MAG: Uma2 family endonuclease [Oscillospiraceae bacterium]|nr:Uma2 family endonuclease [Oscillospiraceae bacterium]MCL2278392.1 Uma2 family endonuclease [Oscillospiraceae bacterium]
MKTKNYADNDETQADDEMQVSEAMPAYDKDGYYTYEDYYSWELEEGERWELIDGKAYKMSAPSRVHQEVLGEIFRQLANFLKGKKCKVYIAPVDVRLNHDTLDDTVVQPDVLVVCDENKLSDIRSVKGAPDLAVEVLSPSNPNHDRVLKFNKYREAGVREFWIVDPTAKTVAVNILTGGYYTTHIHGATGNIPLQAVEGCEVDLDEVFASVK